MANPDTNRECEILLQGAAPHGVAKPFELEYDLTPSLWTPVTMSPNCLRRSTVREPLKSQDFTRCCQSSRDLMAFSAMPAILS